MWGLLVGVGRSASVLALFVVSAFLHNASVPVLPFVLTMLLVAGVLMVVLEGAWTADAGGRPRPLTLFANALLLLLSNVFLTAGLKYAGPVRAVLTAHSEQTLFLIPALVYTWRVSKPLKRRALLALCVGYFFLLASSEPGYKSLPRLVASEGDDESASASAEGGSARAAASAVLSGLQHPQTFVEIFLGTAALILGSALGFLRKKFVRNKAQQIQNPNALHAWSLCLAALLAFPLAFLQGGGGASDGSAADDTGSEAVASVPSPSTPLSSHAHFLLVAYAAVFCAVVPYYMSVKLGSGSSAAAAAADRDRDGKPAPASGVSQTADFALALLSAVAMNFMRGDRWISVGVTFAATAIFASVYWLEGVKSRGDIGSPSSVLPVSMAPAAAAGPGGSAVSHWPSSQSWKQLRGMYKHIMSDKTTMRIFIFLSINFAFMFVEALYGYLTNSLGLISDAGHMLFDCVALAIGLVASYVAKLKPDARFTYGYARAEILSGFINGIFLLFIGYFVLVESFERLLDPPTIEGDNLLVVSVLGLLVNLIGLFFFHDHSHGHSHGGSGGGHGHSHSHGSGAAPAPAAGGHGHSHGAGEECSASASQAGPANSGHSNVNQKAVFLHVLADTLGSVGVITSSILVQRYDLHIADPICSICISLLIIASVGPLLVSTSQFLLTRTPEAHQAAIARALEEIQGIEGVGSVHDVHFWNFTESQVVASLRVAIRADANAQRILHEVTSRIKPSIASNLTVELSRA